jgi:hypothetical protein
LIVGRVIYEGGREARQGTPRSPNHLDFASLLRDDSNGKGEIIVGAIIALVGARRRPARRRPARRLPAGQQRRHLGEERA